MVNKVECSRCHQILDDVEEIKARHFLGRHQHHYVMGERPYQGELMSKSHMGGMDIGPVEWLPVKIKDGAEQT